MTTLPLAAMGKILRSAGATRVAESAKRELRAALEKECTKVGALAFKFTLHSGRKTINEKDVTLALEQMR